MPGLRWVVLIAGLMLALQPASGRADTEPSEASDPPDAVGRIAVISGTVLFRAAETKAAAPALLNYPLSLGNVVESAPRAHVTIDIAAGRFYLDGRTRLRIGKLTDGSSTVALDQGALVLHVLPGGNGQVFSIETAEGVLRLDQPGYYEIETGEGDQPATISAIEGGAQFRTAKGREQVLHPGERVVLADSAVPQSSAVVEDDLIRRVAAEIEDIGENESRAPEYVSSQITGFQDLTRYGIWNLTDDYGAVWEPQVNSDWAPYSRGRWVDVAPWGKTWVDDAPWGFAPFHYGRWVRHNERWVWLPGEIAAAPVYAPALVSFFDTREPPGQRRWIALGPEEPYLPPYRTSTVYFRAINAPALPPVINITEITNIVQITNVVRIVDHRPEFIFSRLVNRPGAPPPRPKPHKPLGAATVMTVSGGTGVQFQNAPTMRPILPEPQRGPMFILSMPPSSNGAPQPQAQPQSVVVTRTIVNTTNVTQGGSTGLGGGVVTSSRPVTVPRSTPVGAGNGTLGTGVPLGTTATAMPPPTVSFGASAGANGVAFPGQ